MNLVWHGGSTTFETKSSYCRVARLGFKRRATAVPKSNLISRAIEFGKAVAGRLKRALRHHISPHNFHNLAKWHLEQIVLISRHETRQKILAWRP